MYPCPVTAITITQLWFKTENKCYILLRQRETKHKHIATAQFLVFLLFTFTISLAKVTIPIRKDPKTMEPKADVNSHLQAVNKQFLPSTLQYQKEQATAIVKTMEQQKTNTKRSHIRNHGAMKLAQTSVFSPLLYFSLKTAKIQLKEQIQYIEKRTLRTTLMTGLMKIPHLSLKN